LEHSISELFKISMESLENMIDVNTVVGDTKKVSENIYVIPISKVKCSYVTGGLEHRKDNKNEEGNVPFGGASGGALTISPVAFLVINDDNINILHLDDSTHLYEKIIDSGVDAVGEIKKMFSKKKIDVE